VAGEDLDRIEKSLDDESEEDARLRQQHGSAWNRPSSAALNSALREKAAGYRRVQKSHLICQMDIWQICQLETSCSAVCNSLSSAALNSALRERPPATGAHSLLSAALSKATSCRWRRHGRYFSKVYIVCMNAGLLHGDGLGSCSPAVCHGKIAFLSS